MTTTTTGYHRTDSGLLEPVSLLVIDGEICDPHGYPLTRTDETAELLGWGESDGPALAYRNDGGREILLPVDKDTLISWLEQGLDNVYEPVGDGTMVTLNDAGAALCEAHGLTVDVDAYGCAYCVEHVIR
jgi:hypothetical protein